MKGNRSFIVIVVTLLLLALATGWIHAQGVLPDDQDTAENMVESRIAYQGVLREAGQPVTGSRDMVFNFFNNNSCSNTPVETVVKDKVPVVNGLFNANLPVDSSKFNGQGLWLQVQVGGVSLGCESLSVVPYALSLRPGAQIIGNLSDGSALHVENRATGGDSHGVSGTAFSTQGSGVHGENFGGGHGVSALSNGSGYNGAALSAVNPAQNGMAAVAINNSEAPTLIVRNNGSGALLQAYGQNRDQPAFQVDNDGRVRSSADTYVFVPGTEIRVHESTPDLHIGIHSKGYARLSPSHAGNRFIVIAATLPSILYGQPVTIKEIRIYYQTSDSRSYIYLNRIFRSIGSEDSGTYYLIAEDKSIHDSTTYSSYALVPFGHATMSADMGFLSAKIRLHFDNPNDVITIGGMRIRLGHQD